MPTRTPSFLILVGIAVSTSAAAKHPGPRPISEFENAEIRVERNATDGDTEVVIFAKGGDEGFRHFIVRSPDRRYIVQFHAPDPGQRELLFESPEPPGDAILAAYPEGTYHFRGRATDGAWFAATAQLSHELPPQVVILSPQDEATIAPGPLLIQWSSATGRRRCWWSSKTSPLTRSRCLLITCQLRQRPSKCRPP